MSDNAKTSSRAMTRIDVRDVPAYGRRAVGGMGKTIDLRAKAKEVTVYGLPAPDCYVGGIMGFKTNDEKGLSFTLITREVAAEKECMTTRFQVPIEEMESERRRIKGLKSEDELDALIGKCRREQPQEAARILIEEGLSQCPMRKELGILMEPIPRPCLFKDGELFSIVGVLGPYS